MDDNLYDVGRLDDIVGNEHAIARLRNFAKEINSGKSCMPLLVYGPIGTGKSVSVGLLARESRWNVVELNAGDYRDSEAIQRRLISAATSRSLLGERNLILLDEIDEMAPRFDRGSGSAITALMAKSKNPIVFIANDMWDQSISFLRGRVDAVEFKRLTPVAVQHVLANVARRHSLKIKREIIEMMANRSNGDARSAINDLSAMIGAKDEDEVTDVIGLRDRKIDIFYMLDRIFLTSTLQAPLRAISGTDLTNEMLIKWLDENIPKMYRNSEDMYSAFDSLSSASTFAARAARSQYYTYWRYMNVLMSSGVALSKRHTPESRAAYSFPRVIKDLSSSKASRVHDRELAKKLQKVFHSSVSRLMRNEMRMLSQIIARSMKEHRDSDSTIKEQLMSTYRLDDKEIEYMLGMNS